MDTIVPNPGRGIVTPYAFGGQSRTLSDPVPSTLRMECRVAQAGVRLAVRVE